MMSLPPPCSPIPAIPGVCTLSTIRCGLGKTLVVSTGGQPSLAAGPSRVCVRQQSGGRERAIDGGGIAGLLRS
jgi:hypothetical protein